MLRFLKLLLGVLLMGIISATVAAMVGWAVLVMLLPVVVVFGKAWSIMQTAVITAAGVFAGLFVMTAWSFLKTASKERKLKKTIPR